MILQFLCRYWQDQGAGKPRFGLIVSCITQLITSLGSDVQNRSADFDTQDSAGVHMRSYIY